MSDRYFRFILCNGTEVSKSFAVVPITYPIASGHNIATGDPLEFTGSPVTTDILDNVYKVENNLKSSNDWYINVTGSNVTASSHIVSGSYITGSLSEVTFNFIDHTSDPLAVKSVNIKPYYKNVGFEDSFVLEDTIINTTDGVGSLVTDLVPTTYEVIFKGTKKQTKFYILPSGSSCIASEVMVSCLSAAKTITPANQTLFSYTAEASDLRYIAKGGMIDSASYVESAANSISASYALSASWAPTVAGGTTLNTGSTYPITASWAQNWNSSSIVTLIGTKQDTITTGQNLAVTASVANTASFWNSASLVSLVNTKQNTIVTGSTLPVTASVAVTSGDVPFNGNRAIKLDDPDFNSVNVGGSTVTEFLENLFFPFVSATVALNSGTTYYQTGSSNNITLTATVTSNDETSFGSGSIKRDGVEIYTDATPTPSFGTTDTAVMVDRTYYAYLQVDNDGSPTVVGSSAKNIRFVYPILYGTSSTAGLTGTDLYGAMLKSNIAQASSVARSFVGTGVYIYYAVPASYNALTSILDPNSFELIDSFDYSSSVSVTSTGLSSDWTTNYKVYRLTNLANPNGTFTFKY